MTLKFLPAILLIGSLLAGCNSENRGPSPLRTSAFAPSKATIPTDPTSPVDRGGALQTEHPNPQGRVGTPEDATHRRREAGEVDANSVSHISPVVRQNVVSPVDRPFDLSSTRASAPRFTTSPSSGQYLTVGGVVAEVNNVPIYADKVVGQIAPILAARARETNRQQFRQEAMREIRDQVQALITLELDYAAAQRNLDTKEKELAQMMTQDWRRHKVAEARSVEIARKVAADQGQDFDEMINEQYRFFMSQIFWQKRLVPRIQVTADDMRRYDDQHIATEFTVPEKVRFRLIKIAVQQVGDRQQARAKIEEIRRRVVGSGEDFAAVASTTNDPALIRTGGELSLTRGAFADARVDQAVWSAPVGSITNIVESPDAFYIAKVEEKSTGRIVPFEEEQAQRAIGEKLRAEQFNAMRRQVQEQLKQQAVVRSSDSMMNTALDMAMENYTAWARK
ncbi:MAG TPA: peptidylprolyl isomerase [Tepidisphaeraceae bacterium]